MADCSYSRCIQQKRNIRRELQRWTKNMVYIVGLERIAEELMGRRKWKLYQESMSRNYLQPLNNNVKKPAEQQPQHHQQQQQVEESPAILREGSPVDDKAHIHNSQQQQQQQDIIIGDATSPTRTTAATPPSENGIGAETASAAAAATGKPENGETAAKITAEDDAEAVSVKEETTGVAEEAERHQEAEDRLKDWSPQSKCYFCVDGKLDSDHNNHGGLSPHNTDSDSSDSRSDIEPLPTLTPNSQNNNHHHHHHHHNSRMTTTVDPNMAVLAAVRNAINSGSPVPHMSFYPQFYPFIAQAAATAGRGGSGGGGGGGGGFNSDGDATEKSGEEPLDLSSKSSNNNGTDAAAKMQRVLPLDAKFSFDFRARPRMPAVAGRRTYTEDELQAALRDIQSGKLGTRRAAVIYGIPRSTLRNKVYKLALERERESHLNPCTLKLAAEDDEPMDEDKDLSGAEEEKEVERVLDTPLISLEDIIRLAKIHNPDTLRVLLKGREDGPPTHLEPDMNPILREVLRKMVVEDKLRTNGDAEKLTRPSPSNSASLKVKSESDMETEDVPSNVILKIPSFKPTNAPVMIPQLKNGCDIYRNPMEATSNISPQESRVKSESSSPPIPIHTKMTPKDVKDVIAKSISVKFQTMDHPTRFIPDLDPAKRGFTPPLSQIPVIQKQPEIRPNYQQPPPQNKPPNTTATTPPTGGKGTRPKRGKYRNYDRDSLVEAVRAVQRGEMSVHRAGSYYGVPHSTLEYKVKERHLMRPRKRDPKPNPVDEKIASLKQNDLRNAEKFKVQNQPHLKPLQRLPPTSPNGRMPIIDPNCPIQYPFPFWAGFSSYPPAAAFPTNPEQYYASQMMQKLQEESRTHPIPSVVTANPAIPPLPKTTRHIAESLLDSGANHSFLDGIIRSSLESGVPGNDEKKEDKSLPPGNLSNKALLDQLCRNSRLTPLPKLTEPSNSSGDEKEIKSSHTSSPARRNEEVHTIDSSNDSNGGSPEQKPRIYLKSELTNPDNLKPENLMRFRDVLDHDERNGVGDSTAGSASDTDAQD